MFTCVAFPTYEGNTVDNASIIEGVRQVIMKTPIDVRAPTLSNIVLIGGTAMIPGTSANTIAVSHSGVH